MSEFPKRIVCVDDEPEIRHLIRRIFEDYDEDTVIVTCGNGAELIARLRELQPELVLLDLKMPGMNGPDTVEKLRQDPDAADVPIIFMTGQENIAMLENYKNLGVIGVIHKPFDPAEFMPAIHEIWDRHFLDSDREQVA